MKENKYDDDVFFKKYQEMERSKKGFAAAGEWETLKGMLPAFQNKRVLDLGCGYGWHCIYAVQQGAASAVGIDISKKMLEVAREKTAFKNVQYHCVAVEDMECLPESFDVAISSLALHYVKDFAFVCQKVSRCLTKGGQFVFSVEHPIFTSYGSQDWVYDKSGKILHFPVDNYFYEGEREACFLGERVVKYHKTLTTYLNGLLNNGFEIQQVIEPQPSKEMIENVQGMKDELRRPMMLLVSARKK